MQKSALTENDFSCGFWREKTAEFDLSPQRFETAEEDLTAILKLIKEKSLE